MNIKENLAKNLAHYRKAMNFTQAELAQKINYSDKAVSKWERGESVPDLAVLKQLADLYAVKIDDLIAEPAPKNTNLFKNIARRRAILCLIAIAFVWLIAIVAFVTIALIIPTITKTWMSFIYAIPITLIVVLILTSVWGRNLANCITSSLLVWTVILAVYLSLLFLLPNPPHTLWCIFLVGVPLQTLVIFFFFYKKIKKG